MLRFLMIKPPRKHRLDSSSSAKAIQVISCLIVGYLTSFKEVLHTRINTGVSNMGIGHQDKLSSIARVSQNLLIAATMNMTQRTILSQT
jgi:hypothetical protein